MSSPVIPLLPSPEESHQNDVSSDLMLINIDASNTFKSLSASLPRNPHEETEDTKRPEDDSSSMEEEDGEGELAVPQIKTRQLKRGLSAQQGAQSIYSKTLSGCSWIQSDKMRKVPKFATKELMMGLVLGSGTFGAVYEVRGFHLADGIGGGSGTSVIRRRKSNDSDDEVTPGEIESRNFIAKHCYRNNGDARYALKQLRKGILEDDSCFMNGMADLANETLYLASLRNHPNIIKLRGIAVENMFSKDYFLILDRLYDTLQVRILKWKKKKNKSKGLVRKFMQDRNGEKKRKLLEERMQYAMDLVAAISYIHEHRIIHRDLKPDNIGFDVRNDIKVFDFGLAKEMPPPNTYFPDETFHFTSAGSPRYMAPEVGLGQKHNQSCDIYSFGLIFWEMMTLKRPFKNEKSMQQLKENVWAPWGPKQRPPVPAKMTQSIQSILQGAWNHDLKARPKAPQLLAALKKECLKLRQDMRISHTQRRSTFVMSERGSRSIELRKQQAAVALMEKQHGQVSHMSVQSATQFDSTQFVNEDGTESSW